MTSHGMERDGSSVAGNARSKLATLLRRFEEEQAARQVPDRHRALATRGTGERSPRSRTFDEQPLRV